MISLSEATDQKVFLRWGLLLLAALLWHIAVFLLPWQKWLEGYSLQDPKIAVEPLSTEQLNQIRQKWKNKSLLLKKNLAESKVAPENARYQSDKNVVVEQEQRAAQTNVIPKPGVSQPGAEKAVPGAGTQDSALKSLGVNYQLKAKSAQKPIPQAVDAGDQAILDKSLPVGSENMLNSERSVYYSFYSRLYESVAPLWQSAIRSAQPQQKVFPGDYTTQAEIVLDQQGRLVAINYIKRSGVPEFDYAVEIAWRKIAHFPNPPKDLLDPDGLVRTGWTFNVSVSKKLSLQYGAPRRVY